MGPEVLMHRKFVLFVCNRLAGALLLCLLAAAGLRAQSADQYALLRKPTISKTQIAFSYGGDLWIVERSGGEARRLTSDIGIEIDPIFSPDGTLIAFTGEYDGKATEATTLKSAKGMQYQACPGFLLCDIKYLTLRMTLL